MTRDTFSLEHIEPWLDSEDPVGLFFNQDNISFSHLSCNISDARKPHKSDIPRRERHAAQQRATWAAMTREQQQERRREKYRKYGV